MKKTILMLVIMVLLAFALPSSDFKAEQLYLDLFSMDYGESRERKEYCLTYEPEDQSAIHKASVLYGENYVEYLVEGEHVIDLFMTEEGAIYAYDGEPLDVRKPDERNHVFASYLEKLSFLLQEEYSSFQLSSCTTMEGKGNLNGQDLQWSISLKEGSLYTSVSYHYLFEDNTEVQFSGTVLTAELKDAKTVVGITKLPSFRANSSN